MELGRIKYKCSVYSIYLRSCRIENSRTVPTTAKKCSGGRNLGLVQPLLLHQMGAGHRLGLLFRIENWDSFWLRFRSFLPSRHCVNTELAFAGGIFSACAMRREKKGENRAVHVEGFVVGMQMHSEAPKRARRLPNVAPGARWAGSGTLESVLRPGTGGTGDHDAQPPVEHSCWRACSMFLSAYTSLLSTYWLVYSL